ncbi:MAG: terminase small subunit [Candidatus Woykebacteria bacterium]
MSETRLVKSGHARALEEKVKRLSPKHAKFLQEYFNNGYNAIEAYTKAGYKAKNRIIASKAASRLLKNVEVQEILDANLEEARVILKSAAPRMAALLVETAESKGFKQGTRITAAREALDRVGVMRPAEAKVEQEFNIQINFIDKR